MSIPLLYWVHNLDPVLLRFNDKLAIHYYGIAYVFGFIAAILLLKFYYRRGYSTFNSQEQETILYALVIGVMVGGRLGYLLLYDISNLFRNPIIFIKIWEGGMASHGGIIGCGFAVWWLSVKLKEPLLKVSDIIVTLAPAGIFFGRIANFINGELWGKVTNKSWAVIFPMSAPPGTPVEFISPRHPSQLYEAGLEGLFLGLLILYRFRQGLLKNRAYGQITGEFFIIYSVVRIFCEFFREPDASLILGLSRGIFYSIILLITGVSIFMFSFIKRYNMDGNRDMS